MKIKCCTCGNEFEPGNDPETGIPNGLGLVMKNGHVYDVCYDCVSKRVGDIHVFIALFEVDELNEEDKG